jgi:hypothetical protein
MEPSIPSPGSSEDALTSTAELNAGADYLSDNVDKTADILGHSSVDYLIPPTVLIFFCPFLVSY